MTISLRTMLFAAAAAVVAAGVVAFVVVTPSTDATPPPRAVAPVFAPATPAASDADASSRPPRPSPDVPIGTVDGLQPGSSLTLLSLRRTGAKVVTARLRISYSGSKDTWFMPRERALGDWYTAADMRLVDETNGREHFVLRNGDGDCLCSGEFEALEDGESSVISAKFPAPPANVTHASLETPGFASFDAVPLS
jgi:hypothetical protein